MPTAFSRRNFPDIPGVGCRKERFWGPGMRTDHHSPFFLILSTGRVSLAGRQRVCRRRLIPNSYSRRCSRHWVEESREEGTLSRIRVRASPQKNISIIVMEMNLAAGWMAERWWKNAEERSSLLFNERRVEDVTWHGGKYSGWSAFP